MAVGIDIPGDSGKLLSFTTDEINDGIEIIDHIERRRCQIIGQQPVSPQAIPTEEFSFPVDHGVKTYMKKMTLPYSVVVSVRNEDGIMIDEITNNDFRQFPIGRYSIEISAPIKIYINVKSEFEIKVTQSDVSIIFDDLTEVYIGARSHHEKPAATITTTDEPKDMMQGISFLSSALKTTTCERSYPTLRGHPPEILIGDRLQIPSVLDKPSTGITIEAPNDYRSIYMMSPLVYYLGADLIPGQEYKLRTQDGFVHKFNNMDCGIETAIERVLKQCFFFDCITRTEGYYQVRLYERDRIEPDVNLDFNSIYKAPISEQIEQYLSVPFKTIKPHLPQWKQTAFIECIPENIESIPFLLHDLAVIRSDENSEITRKTQTESSEKPLDQSQAEISEFSRRKLNTKGEFLRAASNFRSNTRTTEKNIDDPDEYVQVPDTESFEEVWVGEGIPISATKIMTEAFRNRLHRSAVDDDITITVVVNDEEMAQEGVIADEVYGSREQLSFTVNEYSQLKKDELYNVLKIESDFLHYIGHIDESGFECLDGQLDVQELDSIGIDAFLLNACSSYKQATGLINAGAIAGIATIKPILNSGAERIGKAIARLLNLGFPLVSALHIAKMRSIIGDNYMTIGDGSMHLTQSQGGTPKMCKISKNNGKYKLNYISHLTRKRNIGTITIPFIKDNDTYYLASGSTREFKMGLNDLIRFLSQEEMPIRKENNLYWSNDIDMSDLTDS